MSFTTNFFGQIDLSDKSWPNDRRISCNSPSSLADFIESDFNLEEKLEEFEGAFKRDEVVEL